MNKPLISVVVPIYEAESYLPKCMNSILTQTYENIQIILVDDGSTDGSPKLCDDYAAQDNRILVIHKENGGVSSAKNAGVDVATGDYIGFVDSDDWIEPEMYEKMVNLALKYHTEIVMCSYFPEDGRKKRPNTIREGVFDQNATLRNILLPEGFDGFLNNKMFSYDLLHRLDSEGKMLRLRDDIFCEDLLFLCQAVMKTESVAFSTEQWYHYLIRPNSETNKLSKRRLTELDAKQEVIELLNSHDTKIAKALYSNSASCLLCQLYQYKYKDRNTLKQYQAETKKYVREFQSVDFPIKDKIRMAGVILYPPLFCRMWNITKAARNYIAKHI